MLQHPSFKPHLQVEILPGEGLVLLSETGSHVLPDPLYALVAREIGKQRSPDDIAAALAEEASADQIRRALVELERLGFLAENIGGVPVGDAALWTIHGVDPRVAARRVAEEAVVVEALGGLDPAPVLAALAAAGVRVRPDARRAVVFAGDYLDPELDVRNRRALDEGHPWMLVKPIGAEVWIGPVFHPGRTGCWACLAQRLRETREVEAFLRMVAGRPGPFSLTRAVTPATLQVAGSLTASAVTAWIARDEAPELEGTVLSMDVRSGKTRTHTLVARPQCPTCGDPPENPDVPAQPITLRSRRKAFTRDGGHRIQPPEVTLERYSHHVSPITGAVGRLDRTSPPGGLIHSYAAGHNLALPPPNLRALRTSLRSRSGGKGVTDAQARASALAEALERYSGVFMGDEPRRLARMRELGDAAIHPNACMGFSERQYRDRDAWNAAHSSKHRVPLRFDEDARIGWTPLWSLTRQEARYLPTAHCFYRYPVFGEGAMCVVCSNGNAAGNTLEEAILQGFLELVERDSIALWWYNRIPRPAMDLDSFDEPYLGDLRTYLAAKGRDLWVLDLTSDLGIPACAAVSYRTEGSPEQIMLGFGAHLEPRIAVLRATTELTQMLNPFLAGHAHGPGHGQEPARETAPPPADEGDPLVQHWLQTGTLADHPYLVPDPARPPRAAADYPRQWSDDLRDDVLACQALVERLGMEFLVLDQTRPDIGLPVVKVVVPGLRHFWPRYGPGRLYEAPARLGWVPAPLAEDGINPVAMVL